MVINKIDVTGNFNKFVDGFTTAVEGLEKTVLEQLYIDIATICFNRFTGEEFGNMVEHIATNINLGNGDDQYGASYDTIYENIGVVEELYTAIKYHGNGMFRGDGYDDTITLSLKFTNTWNVELVYNANTPLYNPPIFSSTDGQGVDKVIELETEFIMFRTLFKDFLNKQYSHNSTLLHDNDYYALFVGLVELLLMYDEETGFNSQRDILDNFEDLFQDVVESIDPADVDIPGLFYIESRLYVDKLKDYLKTKCNGRYDLLSWGVLGEKILIGLSLRR